ncbi:MAG: maltose acetyltransferase [Shewanella sp. CG18_big_fil_WC_8_21_14_2_50_42_11]|uniref:acyltransferase n=1 Tax=Shewanella TaxID=22 RepID=UPI000C44D4E9|nr:MULTISPECIES: acyltransferase [Shewanella]NCP72631.1 acyltransferase [Shewanella vesiculosa]PIQ02247.1 MAG: maltose acetyltransferase [Shewanella sp. CG18_big_fil_WC_8_21_14_2_50_42_11]
MIRKIFLKLHGFQYRVLKLRAVYYQYIFQSCGKGFRLWGKPYIKNPQNIKLGNNVSINDGAYMNGLGGISIGDNVSISALSVIVSTSLDPDKLVDKLHVNKPIFIGDNVQIGTGAIILPGIRIGNNVMIGAGAVVTKDIDSNCVIVGNPAKMLRKVNEL